MIFNSLISLRQKCYPNYKFLTKCKLLYGKPMSYCAINTKGKTLIINNGTQDTRYSGTICDSYINKTVSDFVSLRSVSTVGIKQVGSAEVFVISEEVRAALHDGIPVVALESTIITHGMPSPHNLKTAFEVEDIVRQKQCVPATVAVVEGRLCVGLTNDQLQELADPLRRTMKISRRDLPYAMATGAWGGTTVSGTLVACRRAGIPVFATGGIGGVHRTGGGGGQWDVSADLQELGRGRTVAVVCAGIKSILDVPATLEYLETQGVSVTVLDVELPPGTDSAQFPDFFTRDSGVAAPAVVTCTRDAARMLHCARWLFDAQFSRPEHYAASAHFAGSSDNTASHGYTGYGGEEGSFAGSGLVFAVPIPKDMELAGKEIKEAIITSLAEATRQGVAGRNVTPFLLSRVAELTGGRSLIANIALVKNNVAVAADIAVALATLGREERDVAAGVISGQGKVQLAAQRHEDVNKNTNQDQKQNQDQNQHQDQNHPVVVVGGSIVDFVVTVQEDNVELSGRTHAGSVRQSYGGVGRNVADALARLRLRPLLISAVGADAHAAPMLAHNQALNRAGIVRAAAATATYCVLLTRTGEALLGVGDMTAHCAITPAWVGRFAESIRRARLVVVDGNIPQDTLEYLLHLCGEADVPVWFEPTDVGKAARPWEGLLSGRHVTFASPNLNELRALCWTLGLGDVPSTPKLPSQVEGFLREVLQIAIPLLATSQPPPRLCPQQPQTPTTQFSAKQQRGSEEQPFKSTQQLQRPHATASAQPQCSLTALMITLGPHGFMIVRSCDDDTSVDDPLMGSGDGSPITGVTSPGRRVVGLHFPPPRYNNIVSVSGAGDCLASGFIAGMLAGLRVSECAAIGNSAAALSLQASPAVPPTLDDHCPFSAHTTVPYTLILTQHTAPSPLPAMPSH